LWENRRKDVKELLGKVRSKNDTIHILLILQLICNIHFFLDKGIIGCPQGDFLRLLSGQVHSCCRRERPQLKIEQEQENITYFNYIKKLTNLGIVPHHTQKYLKIPT